MIRNAIGALIALIGAAAAVWSTFLPWYGGREGKDFALSDLFTADGVSGAQPGLFAGLFLPMLVAALVTIAGLLLRSRLLVALAALIVLAFAVLWIVRQGIAEGSLTFGGEGNLEWGIGIAFASVLVMLLGAMFMAGRRAKRGRGRHRGEPDTRLRRRGAGAPTAGAGGGAAGLAAAARSDDHRDAEPAEPRRAPAAGAAGGTPQQPAAQSEPRTGGKLGAAAAGTGAGAAGMAAAGRGDQRVTGPAGPEPGATDRPAAAGTGATPGEPTSRPLAGAGAGDTTGGQRERTDPAGPAEAAEPGEAAPESTRPMPHTQPISGSGDRSGTGRRAGGAAPGPATGAGAGAGQDARGQQQPARPTTDERAETAGAGMGTFPRDERADRAPEEARPSAGSGASPGEPAARPLAGAGAGGPTRSGDMRAEKGPDAMRPEEARRGTAPHAEAASERKEPLPQRLLHRWQHRGHHGPRGGDHRDAA